MNPKVSVLITSYNHAPLLRRAIDSVLAQQTSFDVQIIAVDDNSSDNSLDILREYYSADRVSVISFAEHYGMMRAYAVGLERCSGEYIAFCDCDDFWIDPLKLQKQVEFMDSETACGLCVTRVFTHGVGAFMGCQSAEYINGHLTYDDLLKGTASIHAQGYYLRKSDFEKYIDFDKFIRLKFPVWDYPIVLELIQHTHFFCLDFYSAVYVKHVESVTNTHKRWKRFKYVMGNHRIRGYYILKYGCKPSTFCYLIYRLCRDIYAVIFKTWNK